MTVDCNANVTREEIQFILSQTSEEYHSGLIHKTNNPNQITAVHIISVEANAMRDERAPHYKDERH